MSNLDDKEPEVQSYLNKEYNDDATKRIDIIKEETQKVDTVKDATQKVEVVKDETQKVELVKDATQKVEKIEEVKVKAKKEKKTATMKKIVLTRVLFIIIFAVIAISLTIYFANKNGTVDLEVDNNVINNVTSSNKDDNDVITNNEKTVDLNGTYYLNPIEFRTYTFDILGNEIEYLQIDGLKDDSVEIKINNELKESIKELSKKICEENKGSDIYSGCTVRGNFANVISITFSISAISDDNNVYEDLYFNYDLVNGNIIELDDIFTSDFAIEEVLIDELYEAVTSDLAVMDEEDWYLYVPEDAEDIEEIVYSIVSDYQRGKKIDFYFTPQSVNVNSGVYSYAMILFNDYSEYVTIYDKYMTSDSIYDGQYKKIDNLPTLTYIGGITNLEEYIEEEGNDYYINVALFSELNTSEKVLETVKKYMNDYITEKKNEEREDGMFRLYNASFYVWEYTYQNEQTYHANIEVSSYDTTKSKYTHSMKNEIIEFFRKDLSDVPEFIGNSFLPRLNYYDEVINYELLQNDYHSMELDAIGNIVEIDGVPVSLETID